MLFYLWQWGNFSYLCQPYKPLSALLDAGIKASALLNLQKRDAEIENTQFSIETGKFPI